MKCGTPHEGLKLFADGLTYNDDIFQGWFGVGPQIDGLSHVR